MYGQNQLKFIALALSCFTCLWNYNYGQVHVDEFVNCIEVQMDKNDLVLNGKSYLPPNPKINGSVYFNQLPYKPGTLFIYGTAYNVAHLRLDIYQDQLILKDQLKNLSRVEVILNPEFIDSFYLNQHTWINNRIPGIRLTRQTYLEKIGKGRNAIYRTQRALYYKQFTSRNPYGRFALEKPQYFIKRQDTYAGFSSKREFLSLFPGYESTLNQFFKKEKIRFKHISSSQLMTLISFLDELD